MNSKAIWLPAVLLLAAAALPAAAGSEPSGQERAEAAGQGLIGTPAPRMVLKTIDGQQIDLGSLYGRKAVYLKFWATWCVPCREQMPHFERTFESAGPDLAVIAINVGFNDTLADVQTYRTRLGIRMPIVIDDGQLAEAFHLRVTPQHVVIGRDGRIQYVGHLASDRLDAALVTARSVASTVPAAKDVSAADTHSYVVGDELPHMTVATLDGKQFQLHPAVAKQRTVLVFLSPWCESYLATSRPGLAADCRVVREKVDALAGNANARWLGIASGLWATSGELAAYRDEHRIKIGLTLDDSGNLFRRFRVMNVPTVVIADESGRIVQRLEPHGTDGASALATAVGGAATR